MSTDPMGQYLLAHRCTLGSRGWLRPNQTWFSVLRGDHITLRAEDGRGASSNTHAPKVEIVNSAVNERSPSPSGRKCCESRGLAGRAARWTAVGLGLCPAVRDGGSYRADGRGRLPPNVGHAKALYVENVALTQKNVNAPYEINHLFWLG